MKTITVKAKVVAWPNGLGWDVNSDAEAWRFGDHLNVSAPFGTRQEWVSSPLRGNPRYVTIFRRKIHEVPLGTDPATAVDLCLRHGRIIEY